MNTPVYWLTRMFVKPAIVLYFRLRRLGREHVPEGGVILASNHRSFLDPFAIGCCIGRPIYFVAKEELFKNPVIGWFLNCLGAFPVMRGRSDEESVITSLALLEGGQAVVIFPEGTRVPSGSLGRPKRGVGRLALESGKPVVPVAVTGSEHARDGWRIKPAKVHIRFGAPLTYPRVENPSPFLAGEVTERIWPCVCLQWEWLGGLPPLRTAAVIGAGSMGTAAAAVLSRAGLDVQLVCRTAAQSERVAAERENGAYLPGVTLDARHRCQADVRDRARGRGPDSARRALPQPPRRHGRAGHPHRRPFGGARGLEGPRAASRHHPQRLRLRARARSGRGHPGRPRARPRGGRAGRLGGGGHPRRRPAPSAARRPRGRAACTPMPPTT